MSLLSSDLVFSFIPQCSPLTALLFALNSGAMAWPLSCDKKQPRKGPHQVFSPAAPPLMGGWGRMDHAEFLQPISHQPQSY